MDAQATAYAKRYRRLFILFTGLMAAGGPMITNGPGVLFSGKGNLLLDVIIPSLMVAVVMCGMGMLIMADLPVKPVRYQPWNRRRILREIGLGMLLFGVLSGLWINRPWSEYPLPESVRLPATLIAVVFAALWFGLWTSVIEWYRITKLPSPHPPGENPTSVAPGVPPSSHT